MDRRSRLIEHVTVDAAGRIGAGTYSCYIRDPAGGLIELVMRGPTEL